MTDRFAGSNLTCVRGGRLIFENLTFALEKGEALVLRGANGTGKSSLLRLMAGLGVPAEGAITWNDTPIADNYPAHAERAHYLGHKNAIKSTLTANENLTFWADLQGTKSDIDKALIEFDLKRLAYVPARLLSSGETRRLALARLIANKKSLWLLDEPTVGLDQHSINRLADLVNRHRSDGGMVIISIHGLFPLENSQTLDLGRGS
ncbi:MAG: heme ABC transporter ATP-binding protein CcmA [Rhodospirillaceae bacterium]|nr:heme ABC transporter ATP-binding protein CcmA [Rhodospirillaceae bacterium]